MQDWTELTIETASEGVELLCAALTQEGFDSFAVEDGAEFEAFLESASDYWDYVDEALAKKMDGLSQVRLYLSDETQLPALQALLTSLPNAFPACSFGTLTLRAARLAGEDWENAWKANYRPLPIGKRFLVVPRWMDYENPEHRLPILLELGLTFGTGEHDSTRLCLQALEALVHGGEHVADLGSGSGILSIAALRLGAGSAFGVDIDPAAEHIARENAACNGFGADCFSACTGNVLEDEPLRKRLSEQPFDLVCANIVAGVLLRLAPAVPQFLKPEGTFLCSGILLSREREVRQALEAAGLRITACGRTEQWCALQAKLK